MRRHIAAGQPDADEQENQLAPIQLTARSDGQLVAATDANSQGETFADRLREIAAEAGCDWFRLTPPAEDWNEALKEKGRKEKERRDGRRDLPPARRPHQG